MNISDILKLATKFEALASGDPVDKIRANDSLRDALNSWASTGLAVDINVNNGKVIEVKIGADNPYKLRAEDFKSKFMPSILQTIGSHTGWISLRFKLQPLK